MSNIALGQAASVDKLFCTNMDVTGTINVPTLNVTTLAISGVTSTSSVIYGTAAVPINVSGLVPTIVTGNVSRVTLYAYNSTLNQVNFILTLPTPGLRNHSFIITSSNLNVIGGATVDNPVFTSTVSPYLSATGNQVIIQIVYSIAAVLISANAQRINVLIISD